MTTPITLKNMGIKWKKSNAFTPVLKLVNKNNKIVSDIMECIQCHIFGNQKTSQQAPPATTKELKYLKNKNLKKLCIGQTKIF